MYDFSIMHLEDLLLLLNEIYPMYATRTEFGRGVRDTLRGKDEQ